MARKTKDYGEAACPICGKSFHKHDKKQVYCCMYCGAEAESRRSKEKYAAVNGLKKKEFDEARKKTQTKEAYRKAEETRRKNNNDVFNKVRSVDWGPRW